MTSSDHLAHGLAGEHTPPDWPPLVLGEVAAVLRHYPQLGEVQGINWHSPRPLSAAALVETLHGVVFIKRHHQTVRNVATLGEEHRLADHLRHRGVPIAAVISGVGGQRVVALGDFFYEMHETAAGVDLYRDAISWIPVTDVPHAYNAGRMLAQLHLAAADYRAPQRDTHILVARSELIRADDPVATLKAQLPLRPGLADYLQKRDWANELARTLMPWHNVIQARLAALPTVWTHGDWHLSNLFWSDRSRTAQVSAVLDFGLSAANFALFDLATAIERNAVAWLALDEHAARPHIAHALIDGYADVRALGADERDLLADLLPLVHVDFALSEVEYYHAITKSPANADLAYDTFLLGHAAWFRTRAGQVFLEAIRSHHSGRRVQR